MSVKLIHSDGREEEFKCMADLAEKAARYTWPEIKSESQNPGAAIGEYWAWLHGVSEMSMHHAHQEELKTK
jgi:hypothetical protein